MVHEVELDVVGRGGAEVADDELDDVPVGGVRLHVHGHQRAYLFGLKLAILPDLPVRVDQHDDAECQRGPCGDRQPSS